MYCYSNLFHQICHWTKIPTLYNFFSKNQHFFESYAFFVPIVYFLLASKASLEFTDKKRHLSFFDFFVILCVRWLVTLILTPNSTVTAYRLTYKNQQVKNRFFLRNDLIDAICILAFFSRKPSFILGHLSYLLHIISNFVEIWLLY